MRDQQSVPKLCFGKKWTDYEELNIAFADYVFIAMKDDPPPISTGGQTDNFPRKGQLIGGESRKYFAEVLPLAIFA